MAGSTPIYGFPYPQSTDLVADYPTLGQELATDVETVISGLGSGLNLMTPTSIANSGGTATLTSGTVTFTTVTSVSLNGCFTSTYTNYRVIIDVVGTGTYDLNGRYRAAGTDASGANYDTQVLLADASTVLGGQSTGATFFLVSYLNTADGGADLLVEGPQAAVPTTHLGQAHRGGARISQHAGRHSLSTAYDGLTLYPTGGTISGTVTVYGYKK